MWFGVKQQKAVSKQNDNDDAYGVAQWEILAFLKSFAFLRIYEHISRVIGSSLGAPWEQPLSLEIAESSLKTKQQ